MKEHYVLMISLQKNCIILTENSKNCFFIIGYFLKNANSDGFQWISRYFPQIRAFHCCLQLKLIILPQKKWGELQANSKKSQFQAFKVTISEVPKFRVPLDEIAWDLKLCPEKLQMTPKHFTWIECIIMSHLNPLWGF